MNKKETEIHKLQNDGLGLARILAAAIVNPLFRRMLLINPTEALKQGYQGETFILSEKTKTLLLLNQAVTLEELAGTILNFTSTQKPTLK